jgi:hypothetical protein
MWLVFGLLAIIFAILNVIWTLKRKDAKWFRYFSLSFTILTLCAEYSQVNQWVVKEDWDALLDVIPYTADGICDLAIASILINSVSLFHKNNT